MSVTFDEEVDVGDVEILRLLDNARQKFKAGDKSQLMHCVFLCARFQAVMPKWAADALLTIEAQMDSGRITDFNDAFGKPLERVNTRAARARRKSLLLPVIDAILTLRAKGVSLNDADMFGQVKDELRKKGLNVNHGDVQKIYASQGKFIKNIPKQKVASQIFGILDFPKPRRCGREVLRD